MSTLAFHAYSECEELHKMNMGTVSDVPEQLYLMQDGVPLLDLAA